MNRWFPLLCVLGILLVGANGCPEESPVDKLVDRTWVLDSYGPSSQTPVLDGSRPTLTFHEDGTCGGSGGCNSFGCSYTTDGYSLDIFDLYSTEMACYPGEIMDQEQAYFRALNEATTFAAGDNWLEIYYADIALPDGILHFHEEATTKPSGG